ncbi:integrase, partial [Pasteurellaceae bacterium LFhippo2]|nr:integrase [Pasteurellaceae bacterium LFhippo2]
MASIQKRGNKYRVQIFKNGVRKNATFSTKAEAKQWALAEENKIDAEDKGKRVDILFSDVIIRYQNEVSPHKKTGIPEIRRLNVVLDEPIANLYISDITKETINDWINARLDRGVKGSSVLRELTILSNIFTYALKKWDYITKNPMDGVDKPKGEKPRTQRYTDEEIKILVEKSGYLESLRKPRARIGGALLFALETGMRVGEVVKLKWDDLHLKSWTN